MDSRHEEQGMGIGWIILLVILDFISDLVLGHIDYLAAIVLAGYPVLKRR